MRTQLYACGWKGKEVPSEGEDSHGWRWQAEVSIDFESDLHYWSLKPDPPTVIVRHKEEMTYTAAINFKDKFEKALPQIPTGEKWTHVLQVFRPAMHKAKSAIDPALLTRLRKVMTGRALLGEEISVIFRRWGVLQPDQSWKAYIQRLYLASAIRYLPGMEMNRKRFGGNDVYCNRCGADKERCHWTHCSVCKQLCPYCEQCLQLGRVRLCTVLIAGTDGGTGEGTDEGTGEELGVEVGARERLAIAPEMRSKVALEPGASISHPVSLEKWSLSPAQTEAAEKGLQFLQKTANHTSYKQIPSFLIWAVTGAGKTEMIFPMIEHELKRGARVAVVSPRRDVVLELVPRLAKAFPNEEISVLYGGSEQKWGSGLLTVATTHQLLRFYRAFACIIIDELDAFPFHNNPMLAHAVRNACKMQGRYILLSATPPPELQRKLRRGLVEHVKVPVRFHRHPLPVPVFVYCQLSKLNGLSRTSNKKGKFSRPLYTLIHSSLRRGAQLFVFVPYIRSVNTMTSLLAAHFPQIRIEGTHSQDTARADKVTAFREGVIRILVTTTILERGVTVPKTDVVVANADHRLFDETSLVQMAGRAGRAHTDPHGRVYFVAEDRTRQMNRAIKQIKQMNRLSIKKGYGIPQKGKGRLVRKQGV